MKNKRKATKIILFIYIFILFSLFFSYFFALNIPTNINLSFNEFNEFDRINTIYKVDKKLLPASTSSAKCDIKLFGLLKVKSIEVNLTKERFVYAGGMPIGIEVSGGVKVVSKEKILTDNQYIVSQNNLQMGDIILSLNGKNINSITDIEKALKDIKTSSVLVKFSRNGRILSERVSVHFDRLKNENSLGLIFNESTTGIGTLTYINENLEFGALGHPISINKKNEVSKINGGNVYSINKIVVNKAYNGVVGRFGGDFLRTEERIGKINQNTLTGIYGFITNTEFIKKLDKYEVGSSFVVKNGKAKLLSFVSGEPKLYDIEIIKKLNTKNKTNKCMVIRITDKELLNKTGGIIQGMSGSPIIQNNRIVGAVTHVFVNEPTKGYGVYIDYMI